MDINTFCVSPIHIENNFDGGGTEWFVFSKQLQDLLELPEEFDYLDILDSDDGCLDLIEHDDGTTEDIELISESCLYGLILANEAPMFATFRKWVTQVVGPIVGHEGFFVIGEERFYIPLGSDHEVQDCDLEYQFWLAEYVLPEIRRNGCYADRWLKPRLNKIANATNPDREMMSFLENLKGDRSREKLTAD
jgi:prophage antirepressor-like protein